MKVKNSTFRTAIAHAALLAGTDTLCNRPNHGRHVVSGYMKLSEGDKRVCLSAARKVRGHENNLNSGQINIAAFAWDGRLSRRVTKLCRITADDFLLRREGIAMEDFQGKVAVITALPAVSAKAFDDSGT